MSDPDLSDVLRRAVPDPPDLTVVARHAERAARARRTRLRGALAGAAAVVLLATAVGVPRWMAGDDEVPGPSTSGPTDRATAPASDSGCGRDVDHDDFGTGTAVWVRFCVLQQGRDRRGPPAQYAIVPTGVLTDGAEALVSAWRQRVGQVHGCPFAFGRTGFRVAIGFADGTVSRIDGETGPCPASVTPGGGLVEDAGSVYDGLMRALAAEPDSTPPALSCPAQPPSEASRDTSLTALASEAPSAALVCHYGPDHALSGEEPLDLTHADELRIATLSSFYPVSGTADCVARVVRDDLALLALRSEIWEVHVVATGCEPRLWVLTPTGDATYLGVAGSRLLDALPHAGVTETG